MVTRPGYRRHCTLRWTVLCSWNYSTSMFSISTFWGKAGETSRCGGGGGGGRQNVFLFGGEIEIGSHSIDGRRRRPVPKSRFLRECPSVRPSITFVTPAGWRIASWLSDRSSPPREERPPRERPTSNRHRFLPSKFSHATSTNLTFRM